MRTQELNPRFKVHRVSNIRFLNNYLESHTPSSSKPHSMKVPFMSSSTKVVFLFPDGKVISIDLTNLCRFPEEGSHYEWNGTVFEVTCVAEVLPFQHGKQKRSYKEVMMDVIRMRYGNHPTIVLIEADLSQGVDLAESDDSITKVAIVFLRTPQKAKTLSFSRPKPNLGDQRKFHRQPSARNQKNTRRK